MHPKQSKRSMRQVRQSDADALFPLIYGSKVVETIAWNGPSSLEEYRRLLAEREETTRQGQTHYFTICENDSPVGAGSLKPYYTGHRADIGLWIGEGHQGK